MKLYIIFLIKKLQIITDNSKITASPNTDVMIRTDVINRIELCIYIPIFL